MKRKLITIILISCTALLLFFPLSCRDKSESNFGNQITLLIRCDDIGMCHAVNIGLKKLIKKEIPFSASIMFTCPWYQEAVAILKEHTEISVGVHLTLNAEWKNYRWGPVLGSVAVPSLVDSCGYFFPSRKLFFENNPNIKEIEKELRAQIERALQCGLKIDYLDYHMGTAVSTPELRALVEKLALEYQLGISRYFGEVDVQGLYAAPLSSKKDTLRKNIENLQPGTVHLLVFHIGTDTPEMQNLIDLNPFGLAEMSKHRQAELEALCSEEFRKIIDRKNFNLITYQNLIKQVGLKSMKLKSEAFFNYGITADKKKPRM